MKPTRAACLRCTGAFRPGELSMPSSEHWSSDEFLRQSRTIAESWRRGSATRYEEIAGTNHFTVVDPLADPNSAMTARVAALAQSTNSLAL